MTRRSEPIWSEEGPFPIISGHREIDEWQGTWRGTDPVDMMGREIKTGDYVAKAYTSGRSGNIEVRRVGRVTEDGEVYLGESKVAIVFPGRLLILADWPL